MKESQFIEENKKDWKELEKILKWPNVDPNKLHSLFIKVSSDLSYARTFFPNRSVRVYLNRLTQEVFETIKSREDKLSIDHIKRFFVDILPFEVYRSKNAFLTSLFCFTIAVMIGVFSASQDAEFLRLILGDSYVEMTDNNINDGDPMAVYKGEESSEMFLGITINNVRVAFLCFVLGIMGIFGTIIVLMFNGIMLGAFQYYFYSKGLFVTSFMTIWIHGTLEISAIVIAGAAGIVMGSGLLFPGTLDRGAALQISAQRGLRILLGTVPLFIVAGFLESFVTRLTEAPMLFKATIIGGSALFIVFYFIIYPWRRNRQGIAADESLEIKILHQEELKLKDKVHKASYNFGRSFKDFRSYFGLSFKYLMLPFTLLFAVLLFAFLYFNDPNLAVTLDEQLAQNNIFQLAEYFNISMPVVFIISIATSIMLIIMKCIFDDKRFDFKKFVVLTKTLILPLSALLFIYISAMVFIGAWSYLFIAIFPPHFFVVLLLEWEDQSNFIEAIKQAYQKSLKFWPQYFVLYLFNFLILSLISLLISSPYFGLIIQFVFWHEILSSIISNEIFVRNVISCMFLLFISPLIFATFYNAFKSANRMEFALDLNDRFNNFGNNENIFESNNLK